mmetsp:Transcript_10333/g.26207  ORF Transcript_10333/g.26207 Transcript_10333/m.26207 type:complete len:415 (-) Transcript_10333:330-1574(-)
MAFFFRSCQRSDPEPYADDRDLPRDEDEEESGLPRSFAGRWKGDVLGKEGPNHSNFAPEGDNRLWCCRVPFTYGRQTRVIPADSTMYAAELAASVQKKAGMPARSPSRKLTPYPGKTAVATLQHLEMIAPAKSTMDRNRSQLTSSNSTIAASRASSICANSGARPKRISKANGSGSRSSNEAGSKGRASGSDGTASGSGGTGGGSGTTSGSGGQDSRGGTEGSGKSAYSSCSFESIDWSKPPSSLLEASMRRVALNEKAEMEALEKERIKTRKKYPRPIKVFTESFFRGLVSGHIQWASAESVSASFHEDARMVTHDGQMYYGRTGIIKRLNRGMERLLKMLGDHKKITTKGSERLDLTKLQEMGLECCEPVKVDESTWSVRYNMKKGVLRYSFEDEFVLEETSIKKLTRRMIR